MFHNGVGSGAKRQMTFQTSSLLPTSFESVSVFVMSIFTTATRKSENSCFLNYGKTSSSLKKNLFAINVSCLFVVESRLEFHFHLWLENHRITVCTANL